MSITKTGQRQLTESGNLFWFTLLPCVALSLTLNRSNQRTTDIFAFSVYNFIVQLLKKCFFASCACMYLCFAFLIICIIYIIQSCYKNLITFNN